jgi:ribosomal protein L32
MSKATPQEVAALFVAAKAGKHLSSSQRVAYTVARCAASGHTDRTNGLCDKCNK